MVTELPLGVETFQLLLELLLPFEKALAVTGAANVNMNESRRYTVNILASNLRFIA